MASGNSKLAKAPQQQRPISSFFTPKPASAKRKKPSLLVSSGSEKPLLPLIDNPEQARHSQESPASPAAETPLSAPLSRTQSSKQARHSQESSASSVKEHTAQADLSNPRSVIGKRVRVYWPLDDAWYEGSVKDYASPDHLIQYDDGEEESLCLENEKVEWVSCEKPTLRRRLRKLSFLKESPNVQTEDCLQEHKGIGRSSKRSRGSDAGIWNVEENGIKRKNNEEDMDDDDTDSKNDDDDNDYDAKSDMKIEDESDDSEFIEDEDAIIEKTKKTAKHEAKNKSAKSISRSAPSKAKAQKTSTSRCKGSETVFDEPTGTERHSVNEQSNGSIGSMHVPLSGAAAERFGLRAAEKFKFLDKDRKDASGNRPGDPGYNPRTLFLPPEFTKGLSAGQRQWWEFKSKHMDKVLLFKMGKFYELFEMDAHIGAQSLDLNYMKKILRQPLYGLKSMTQ